MKRRKKNANELPLTGHLLELRKVFLIVAYAVLAGALIGWFMAPYVLNFLKIPAENITGVNYIVTAPMENLMVYLKLSVIIGIFIAAPVIFWQLWSFILPALKKSEKKYVYIVVPASVLLFVAGATFCYLIVLPLSLTFFASIGAETAENMYTLTNYLNFSMRFLLCFGLIFELPVVLLMLMKIGVLSPASLARVRKYAFFFIVVAAVIISPTPDLWTLGAMIIPMYILYEASIWIGLLLIRRKERRLAAAESGK